MNRRWWQKIVQVVQIVQSLLLRSSRLGKRREFQTFQSFQAIAGSKFKAGEKTEKQYLGVIGTAERRSGKTGCESVLFGSTPLDPF
jgi:hypothetical protein